MNGKVSTHLYLSETLYRNLYLLAKLQNSNISAVIKNILETSVKTETNKIKGSALLKKLAGYKIKGPKNLSLAYKKYLFD